MGGEGGHGGRGPGPLPKIELPSKMHLVSPHTSFQDFSILVCKVTVVSWLCYARRICARLTEDAESGHLISPPYGGGRLNAERQDLLLFLTKNKFLGPPVSIVVKFENCRTVVYLASSHKYVK